MNRYSATAEVYPNPDPRAHGTAEAWCWSARNHDGVIVKGTAPDREEASRRAAQARDYRAPIMPRGQG